MVLHADLYSDPTRGRPERIIDLLDLVPLTERRASRVSTYSGGMKRRLALARALLHHPRLLYLDEPTLGVDVQSRRAIWEHILGLKAEGRTVLITTNYLEEASVLCDRLAIIDRGRLVELDTLAALRRKFGDTVIELWTEPAVSAETLDQVRRLAGVSEAEVSDGRLKVSAQGEDHVFGELLKLITRSHELKNVAQREPSLDEVFLALTGEGLRD